VAISSMSRQLLSRANHGCDMHIQRELLVDDMFERLYMYLCVRERLAKCQFAQFAGRLGGRMKVLSVHPNWLESCGGCCTAGKLCTDLSHMIQIATSAV